MGVMREVPHIRSLRPTHWNARHPYFYRGLTLEGVSIGLRIHCLLCIECENAATVSGLRPFNRHPSAGYLSLPQWQTVSFADVKDRVGIPTNNATIVPLNIPFCQPLNIPPYWQGAGSV